MLNRSTPLKAIALATVVTVGIATAASAQPRDCVDTLAGMPEFSRFTNGIVLSHLVGSIRTAHDITIFAPTNQAVSRVNPNLVDRLFPQGTEGSGARDADMVLAPAAFGAHAVQGRHDSASLRQSGRFTSMSGTPLSVSMSGGTLVVTGTAGTEARVTRADIVCSNGIIHGIDAVLIR